MVLNQLTIPEAIQQIFSVDVAKESLLLKNKANSLVRNGLIKVHKEKITHKYATYLAEGQLLVLRNALIINAFFYDPKDVKKIFEDIEFRRECASTMRAILFGKNTITGISLNNALSQKLVDIIDSDTDLKAIELPNPFEVLPQVALGENSQLLYALLTQAAATSISDNILLAYLEGDLLKAKELADQLNENDKSAEFLKGVIDKAVRESAKFDDLLDFLRPK